MKRNLILCVVLTFTILQSGIVFADNFNVVVDSKQAESGEIVEINVTFENNSGILAAILNAEYDKERLELVGIQDGQLLEGGTFSPNYKSYPYKMVWNSASYENFINDGTLVVLKFMVIDDAPPGRAFIKLSYDPDDIFDVDLNNVNLNILNGGVDVKAKRQSNNTGGSIGYGSIKNNSIDKIEKTEMDEDTDKEDKTPVEIQSPFLDMEIDDWFYNAVVFAWENNITSGISELVHRLSCGGKTAWNFARCW